MDYPDMIKFEYHAEAGAPQPVFLSIMSCFYVDFPETLNRTYCSDVRPSHCVHCPILGQFVSGESLDEYRGGGHITSLILSILGLIIGLFGALANSLIIVIMRKRKSGKAFDTLLTTLAWCDLFSSVVTIVSAIAIINYFQNVSRGKADLYAIYIGTFSTFLGRSLSSFTTVLIAIERYLAIAFPLNAKDWFTNSRNKWMVTIVVLFSTIMSFPRFSSIYITENKVGRDIPGMSNFSYIFYPSPFESFWYVTLGGFFDTIDFWLPLPLLLLFNGLAYWHIRKFEQRRQELSKKVRKDIKATKMFVPVVVILFLCNIEPIFHYFYILNGTIYREHYCGVMVSLAVNAAANLPIYYFKGTGFRHETRAFLSKWLPISPPKGSASDLATVGSKSST